MNKNIGWIIQFSIGTLMIVQFIIIRSIIDSFDSYLDTGIMIGLGGMFLFWGIREILGALAKQYKIRKFVLEINHEEKE